MDGHASLILRIVGPHLEEPVPGLPNILWIISPPFLISRPMVERYQTVFCASRGLLDQMGPLRTPAFVLPQATETSHFHPCRRPPASAEIPVLFVGAHGPRAQREIVTEAAHAAVGLQVWGPGWEGILPDGCWRGQRLDYDDLAETYARARVILNSHMPDMALKGFMSNRSYDALASGALVVSDHVSGYSDPDLPELRMVQEPGMLVPLLRNLLAGPGHSLEERIALHDRMAQRYGFDSSARAILDAAERLLAEGRTARPAFAPRPDPATEPVAPPHMSDPALSAGTLREAMLGAASEILAIATYLEKTGGAVPVPAQTFVPAPASHAAAASPRQGVIHPLMADLREMQGIARDGTAAARRAEVDDLTSRARRVHDVLSVSGLPHVLRAGSETEEQLLVRIMQNAPLWTHSPDGFDRERGKRHLRLWPRRQAPVGSVEAGVFLHLYHDSLAPTFADRLERIKAPIRVYVSTDTDVKAERIARFLPRAEIRVLENRGRDIWPKLYGFADAHDRHEIILHLHGKTSPHSGQLDGWLTHVLDCLISSPVEVNRILSFFATIPRLGMVKPGIYPSVLGAAHWGANRDIARELAARMGARTPLPSDRSVRFPVGSMFWARTAAIRPLLDLRLEPSHFPPESGQLDGTLAHAIERMLGVTCQATGYHLLPVAGAAVRAHLRHQMRFESNGALRDALESGVFDD